MTGDWLRPVSALVTIGAGAAWAALMLATPRPDTQEPATLQDLRLVAVLLIVGATLALLGGRARWTVAFLGLVGLIVADGRIAAYGRPDAFSVVAALVAAAVVVVALVATARRHPDDDRPVSAVAVALAVTSPVGLLILNEPDHRDVIVIGAPVAGAVLGGFAFAVAAASARVRPWPAVGLTVLGAAVAGAPPALYGVGPHSDKWMFLALLVGPMVWVILALHDGVGPWRRAVRRLVGLLVASVVAMFFALLFGLNSGVILSPLAGHPSQEDGLRTPGFLLVALLAGLLLRPPPREPDAFGEPVRAKPLAVG